MEFILIPLFYLFFFGGVLFFLIFALKKALLDEAAFKKWVEAAGYTYLGPEPQTSLRAYLENRMMHEYVSPPAGLELSSYQEGTIYRGLTGGLPVAHNHFSVVHQIETRGSGKNKRNYMRTIASVQIPDTRLQLIINSKVNNDIVSGGNLTRYSKLQRYSLEGNFGTYFEVYMPKSTQSEALTLLAPDVMHYIMTDLGDFDIEINGNHLYLYTYKHLRPADLGRLLKGLEGLLRELKLREGDNRDQNLTNAQVAHTIASTPVDNRLLTKSRLSALSIVGIVLLIAAGLLLPSVVMYKIINNSGSGVGIQVLVLLAIAFAGVFWAIIRTIGQILTRQRLKQQYFEEIHKHPGDK